MDKRTLGCICDHGTTECKDIVSLCDAHRGYCGVYVCNKGLQEILRLAALNDAMNCYSERSEAIQFLNRWILQSDIVKMLKQVQHDDWVCSRIENVGQAMPDGFSGLPRKSDDFLAMTDNRNITKPMRNEQNGLVVIFSSAKHHKAQETKPDRCRNMIKPMRNEQNGLVVMFSSAKHHKVQETKPETDRNQIQNKLWQKQSNRNISTCVAQREVA